MNHLYDEARQAMEHSSTIAIAGHVNPDGDCYGSVLGLGLSLLACGKQVTMLAEDFYSHYSYIPGFERLQKADPEQNYDLFIRVDLGSRDRMGSAAMALDRSAFSINFDHHLDNDALCDIVIHQPEASSTCEILGDFIYETGLPMTADAATALYTGLTTDSNRFLYDSSGPRTLRIAARLMESGAEVQRIYLQEYQNEDPAMVMFRGDVIREALKLHEGRIVLANLTQERISRYGLSMPQAEGVVDDMRSLSGVEIAVILKEEAPDLQKISFRSKAYYDVSTLAAHFLGGGHKKAAGGRIEAGNAEAFERLRSFLEEISW